MMAVLVLAGKEGRAGGRRGGKTLSHTGMNNRKLAIEESSVKIEELSILRFLFVLPFSFY